MSIPKLAKIPSVPGVYFFRDKNGKVLYLGKAANLKNRLKSYFDKSRKNPRLQKMLETAENVDWQETGSEVEALILESQLIKKYRPPFNIMLRDDKQYFYVGFTREQFPKLIITHRPLYAASHTLRPNFVGPFTDGTALKTTLKLLRRAFPYCTCPTGRRTGKQAHNTFCLNYHLGNCLGFCCLKKEATAGQVLAYRKNVAAIKEVLSGKKKSVVVKFEKELAVLAQKEKFEKAIELRDKIEKLKKVFENARILSGAQDDNESPHNRKNSAGPLTELKRLLKLSVPPRRIEGYDVSNIQGEFATGAMVVFTDGKPDKNEYRKFRVRSAGGDTAMLQEIITRRFNHPEWPYPDLILIDGGKGQLSAAVMTMSNIKMQMSKNIPVIALTKDARHKGDHIYTSTKKSAISLKNLPPIIINLILQIDAEAHRFAIGYYRKLHGKMFR
jgi:excinuclease ABC subunit C